MHRIRDKKNNGYYRGQNLVFLVLVTDTLTFPVGFAFYEPDSSYKKWEKENKKLKKEGITKKDRPRKPKKNKKYPTKLEIAVNLLSQFFRACHGIQIKCILADALYGSAEFVERASKLNKETQVVSQVRSNQLVRNKRGLLVDVKSHFKGQKPTKKQVSIRGGSKKQCSFVFRNYILMHKRRREL